MVGVSGLGKTIQSFITQKSLSLYYVHSVEEMTVNKWRPCPWGAYMLLRER